MRKKKFVVGQEFTQSLYLPDADINREGKIAKSFSFAQNLNYLTLVLFAEK